MKLKIQSVTDKGQLNKERLLLKVLADTDVGDYVILQSGYDEDSVTIDTYYAYWPPYKRVEAGDLVIVYTKSGRENEKRLPSGKQAHFFYWGLGVPIWSRSDRALVLMHCPKWISKSPKEL